MKILQIPQKLYTKNFTYTEQMLRARNCHLRFIKNLLPEKRKENMLTKQLQFEQLPLKLS